MPRTKPEPTEDAYVDELVEIMSGTSGQAVIAFFDRHPELDSVPFHICNAFGPARLIENVHRLRRLAVDPSRPRQERREAKALLKLTGYDDASLRADDDKPAVDPHDD